MVRIRGVDELILNAVDFYRAAQPQLDTKPGTVTRNIFIDGPSQQLSRVYDELSRIKAAQSLRLASGSDLDRLASNYGVVRKQGSNASGFALLTFNSIDSDIAINTGDIVTANNGASFSIIQSTTVSPVSINQYRATASKFRADLDFVGINDQYAVEVPIRASTPGVTGNISKYALSTVSTPGVSNVTNTSATSGGSSAENDQTFRNRVLALFSGANTGTAVGYKNAVLAVPQVLDAVVIEPGDPLMTRDGTQVNIAEDGTRTIISEGTGGKVDIYIQGVRFVSILDSYIYRDKSNKNDPTDPANDFVLGQFTNDIGKTVSRRRIENLDDGVLPEQPVNNIVTVAGTSSGANFVQKQVDSLGRVTGNYELIRDTGVYGGSPFGFDRLHWIDNEIRDFTEDQTKGRLNGQDALTFSDVTRVGNIFQNISVVNENSRVNPNDRSSIQLAHFPCTSVTRVQNVTTGERYVVTGQNPDGTGSTNENGRITISGSTLPSISDILQVDYTWVFDYDSDFDYDNLLTNDNPRSCVDSVDWGFSNAVSREQSIIQLSGSLLLVNVTHPIASVINVNTFVSNSGVVSIVSGRLAVVVSQAINNVVSVLRTTDKAELYNTNNNDGTFSGLTIFLPTDTVAQVGDPVTVTYNASDVFTVGGVSGSFSGSQITLPTNPSLIAGTIVEVNYIADVRTLLPQILIPTLPALRNGNGFTTTTAALIGTQPCTNVYSGTTVIQNLRKAPSRLQLTIGGTISPGTITISGTTFSKVANVVVTAANNSLTQNLSTVIRQYLDLSSSDPIPSNVFVSRVTSVQKVRTTNDLQVLDVEFTYDLEGYKINNNSFVLSESVQDTSLTATEFTLPATPDNISNTPSLGDRLLVTFDIATTGASENVSFSKSGSLSTQNRFAIIDSVVVSSGFTSGPSQTATLTINNMNQPNSDSRYNVAYDYIAPKSNERISITYNKNAVISDSTFAIENVRPINADVLAKAATAIIVDVELAIVITPAFINSTSIVKQNVADALTSALSPRTLGTIVDQSDLINVAYSVNGVDRVRVIYFNRDGETGSVLSIEAQKNEYIQAGTVIVNSETR